MNMRESLCDTHFSLTLWRLKQKHTISSDTDQTNTDTKLQTVSRVTACVCVYTLQKKRVINTVRWSYGGFGLCSFGLLKTSFTGVQIQTQILQELTLFLEVDRTSKHQNDSGTSLMTDLSRLELNSLKWFSSRPPESSSGVWGNWWTRSAETLAQRRPVFSGCRPLVSRCFLHQKNKRWVTLKLQRQPRQTETTREKSHHKTQLQNDNLITHLHNPSLLLFISVWDTIQFDFQSDESDTSSYHVNLILLFAFNI